MEMGIKMAKTKKIHINLSNEKHMELKIEAVKNATSIQSIVEKLIDNFLTPEKLPTPAEWQKNK